MIFNPLSDVVLRKIARILMRDVAIRLDEQDITLVMTDDAINYILEKSYDHVSK